MKEYRKKPIVVEAIQWTGGNLEEVLKFCDGCKPPKERKATAFDFGNTIALQIRTLEGNMNANIGDYIIKEPFDKERGFYPCKPDIFEATYEIKLN